MVEIGTGNSCVLLLEYDQNGVPDGGMEVYSQLRGLSKSYGKDAAGHVFHYKALIQAGVIQVTCEEDSNDVDESEDEPRLSSRSSAADFSSLDGAQTKKGDDGPPPRRGKKKKVKKASQIDLYALLGLQNERWMATEAQIKAAYRRTALEHHPDKQRAAHEGNDAKMQEVEDRFKAIQEAYETLCDPTKRREFDSLDPFDDSLPTELDAVDWDSFSRHFGAAFKRNAKWSMKQPVPDIGDGQDADDLVDAFYDFWFGFKSWREFPHPDEEDVEAAESREERRWIERYNAKLREKAKKEEVRRIREFVELSYKVDPRVVARKERQRLEKERQQAEKEAARLKKIQEEKEAEEREKQWQLEEEMRRQEEKKQKQAEKKALQKERSKLRKLTGVTVSADVPAVGVSISYDDVEEICLKMDIVSLQFLNASLEDSSKEQEKKQQELAEALKQVQNLTEAQKIEQEASVKAVAAAAKEERKEQLSQRIAKLHEWSQEEIRLLRKAMDKFPPGTAKRWDVVQGYLRTRTVDEILDMVKFGLKSGKFENDTQSVGKKKSQDIKSAATHRDESFTDVVVNKQSSSDTTSRNATSETEWSQEEEMKLVKALKEIPKTDPERWDKVASVLGSKTKVQCALRFKELKASVKSKK